MLPDHPLRAKFERLIRQEERAGLLDKTATKYQEISYLKVLEQGLKVMDNTAISLCMDNKLPIVVFNLRKPGNLRRVITGEAVGTTVRA